MAQVRLDLANWLLPIATAVGAWGGFPAAPSFFTDLAKNELFQYFMLFVLIWQGGGGQDVGKSLMMTLFMFIFIKMFSNVSVKFIKEGLFNFNQAKD